MSRSGRRQGGRVAVLAVLVAAMAASACSERPMASPLTDARPTPEALAGAAVRAIAARDDSALRALMVTRKEYETYLWPQLPERRSTTLAFAWGVNQAHSRKARQKVLESVGGQPLEVEAVELGEEERYDGFTLYIGSRVRVRRPADGEEGYLPLADVLVRMDGAWKFVNFKDRV